MTALDRVNQARLIWYVEGRIQEAMGCLKRQTVDAVSCAQAKHIASRLLAEVGLYVAYDVDAIPDPVDPTNMILQLTKRSEPRVPGQDLHGT